MKNNRFYTVIIAMVAFLSCHAQSMNSNGLREKLKAFVESGEYKIQKPEKPNEGVTLYHFAMQFATDSGWDDHYSGPLLTPHMLELDRAFKTEAVNAKTIYIHDASEGGSPLTGVQFRYQVASQAPTRYSVPFEKGKNIRLITFDEADGQFYALLLIYEQAVDHDKNGDFILMNGSIHEICGKKLPDEPYLTHHLLRVSQLEVEEMSVDVLTEKVKHTCAIFKRETPQGRMAAAVVLNRTCSAYQGTLTQQQYYDLLGEIQPLVDSEKNEELKNILAYSCYMLYKKSEIYVEAPSAEE